MKRINFLKDEWPQLLILLLPFAILAAAWDQLPERLPTHWGLNGHPNGYTEKGIGFFLIPLLNVGLAALLIWIGKIDPKANKMNLPSAAMKPIRLVITAFLSAMVSVTLLPSMGMNVDVKTVVELGLPIMFLLIGNYLPAVKPNYFVGIRTPWTLESPENWRLTHAMAGKLWVIASAIFFVLQFFLSETLQPIFFGVYLGVIIIPPLVYSYMLFQKSKRA